ncbi:SMI1/KNR4 family protein [Micromonospora sp. WMMD967]|uniref:SMI1/KNR4 family protein n=1 Tax=Micromonospora sp. WMMD967 TaxID=3016101 RepID=UPI00241812F0|nr:SMI1/KNR4 family protein [Micromonospora sp. WMMD967]MDG4838637.1 SMI1/KNR4 family protein [Micromonospora sp. WMMD967]
MTDEDRTLPAVLVEAHAAGFFHEHSGHDFEPYDAFMWSADMVQWWQTWTNDPVAGAPPLRAFGQDGTGGLAAFWLRNPGDPLDHQPVVFLGSDGEYAVIARDLADYLWLLANGVGPLETVDCTERVLKPIAELTTIAHRHTGSTQRSTAEVIAAARAQFPAFEALLTRTHGRSRPES